MPAAPPPAALWQEARAAQAAGDAVRAEAACRALLAQAPGHAEARLMLGRLLLAAGDVAAARVELAAALAKLSGSAAAQAAFAAVRLAGGAAGEAEIHARVALGLEPGRREALATLAEALLAQGLKAEARLALAEALAGARDDRPLAARIQQIRRLAARPGAPGPAGAPTVPPLSRAMVFAATGHHLHGIGRLMAAETALLQALALDPATGPAHLDLGILRMGQGEDAAAEAHLRRATELMPQHPASWQYLGQFLMATRGGSAALPALERALALAPDQAGLHWQRGMALLGAGRLREGFAAYERRREALGLRMPPRPHWDGGALAGRTILVAAEQGMGDTLQFARYLPLLAERGARVLLTVQPVLRRLFEGFPGVATLVEEGGMPPYDLQVLLMSLPHLFGTTLETIPPPVAPVGIPADAPGLGRVRAAPGLRVGLVWAGRPTHLNDQRRSMPLQALAPLAALPDVSPFALQREAAETDIEALGLGGRIVSLGPGFADLADTAAVVAALDAVVAVDTGVAHLAATLGRPTLLALPAAAEWRWLEGRADSPWYPSVRLFRQPASGDWAAVGRALAAAVAALAQARKTETGGNRLRAASPSR